MKLACWGVVCYVLDGGDGGIRISKGTHAFAGHVGGRRVVAEGSSCCVAPDFENGCARMSAALEDGGGRHQFEAKVSGVGG